MPAPRVLPPIDELRRLRDSGLTHAQIAERVSEQSGRRVGRSSVAAALSRAGLTEPAPRYAEEIPWRVATEHLLEYPLRMLRLLGRRRAGHELSLSDEQRLESWLSHLSEYGAVVGYSPDRGAVYVAAEPGEGSNGVPVRTRPIRESEFAD